MANDETYSGDVLADSKRTAALLNKQKEWFGMHMDADMRSVVNPAWIMGIAYAKSRFGGAVEGHADHVLEKLGTKGLDQPGSALSKTALTRKFGRILGNPKYLSATVFGLIAASPLLPSFVSPVTKWRQERAEMVNNLMPVFQDMKADGLSASLGMGHADNEVIWAARRRLNNTLTHKTVNNTLELASTQVMQFIGAKEQGKAGRHSNAKLTAKQVAKNGELAAANGDASAFLSILPGAVDMVVNRYTRERNKNFLAERNSVSSYDLIINLVEELKNRKGNPEKLLKEQFSYPRNAGPRSDTLQNYIATTVIAHAEDMARLQPEQYTELRDSLKKDELKEVSKVLAEAIAKGDLPTLSLVRLIGEGHIIKNGGRGLCDVETLKDQLEQNQSHIRSYARVDAKDYMQHAIFTEAEAKETFNALDAEQRMVLASMMPTSVLKKIGVSEAEIAEAREKTAPIYEETLAQLVVGIAQTPEEELKAGGLSGSEIKAIQQAADTISKDGVKAVHNMRANANQPIGIEHQVINAAMPKLHIGETNYLGTLKQAGQQKLAGNDKQQQSHADKIRGKSAEHRSEPSMDSHAEKLAARKSGAQHQQEDRVTR